MGVIDKIKDFIGGNPHVETSEAASAPEDSYLGTQLSTTGVILEPSTQETDASMRDVGSEGVQPVSKPVEVEREQGAAERPDIDTGRKN